MTFYSFESADVYVCTWLFEWTVSLTSVWPLLLSLEFFPGSGFNSAEIQMQTEEKMTQQVSVLGINKGSNANKLDLQVLDRFWENSALIC